VAEGAAAMNLDLPTQTKAMQVGNLAGWGLALFASGKADADAKPDLLITHKDYYARIEAALPGDLSGGRFQVTIDRVTDAHYKIIKSAKRADLFLFWQDANPSLLGALGNIVGISSGPSLSDLAPALVARVALRRVRRRPGIRGYETVIEGL